MTHTSCYKRWNAGQSQCTDVRGGSTGNNKDDINSYLFVFPYSTVLIAVVGHVVKKTLDTRRVHLCGVPVQVLPDTVDIRRVERYELLKSLLISIRRRRRLVTEYQAMTARIVRTLAASSDDAELEVSVYDRLRDQQAKRFKEALVSRSLYSIGWRRNTNVGRSDSYP